MKSLLTFIYFIDVLCGTYEYYAYTILASIIVRGNQADLLTYMRGELEKFINKHEI